eukprot:2379581-Amphidinium_carterae.1
MGAGPAWLVGLPAYTPSFLLPILPTHGCLLARRHAPPSAVVWHVPGAYLFQSVAWGSVSSLGNGPASPPKPGVACWSPAVAVARPVPPRCATFEVACPQPASQAGESWLLD